MTSLTLVRETYSAGARPNTIPVTKQTTAKNPNTIGSMVNTIQYGLPMSCVLASNHRIPA